MPKCLFVMEDWPITPIATGGASALIYSHLELVAHSAERVVLVILANPQNSLGFEAYKQSQPELWKSVSRWCDEVHVLDFSPTTNRMSAPDRLLRSFFEPAWYSYGELISSPDEQRLKELIEDIAPDWIWAEHLIPATLVHQIVHDRPVIYSHHDWRWKIKSLRTAPKSPKQRLNYWFSKKHETKLVQQATGCVSGSASELEEMSNLGVQKLGYFPATYDPIDPAFETVVEKPPRIIHLGSMQATANQLGLQRFLQVCWPILSRSINPAPELWVIGNLDGAIPELLGALQQKNIVCTGIVPDLKTVLRPFDIHIVPWEYDTGTRTRIPLVLNHAQVLVSTRAAASCFSHLQHDHDCVLAKDLYEMIDAIRVLYSDTEKRMRLALTGQETFLRFFTRAAQQTHFNSFIHDILNSPQSTLVSRE
jgi:hypothetical protein